MADSTEPMEHPLPIRFPGTMYQELVEESESEDRSVAWVVRLAVAEHQQRRRELNR